MSRLGRILGGRGRRAADDHDTTTTVDPAADSGEPASGLWESGAYRERAADGDPASALEPGTGASSDRGDTLVGLPQRDSGGLDRAWEPSPVSDGGDPDGAAPHRHSGDVGSRAIETAGTGGDDPGSATAAVVAPGPGTEGAVAEPATATEPAEADADADASPAGFAIRPRSRMRRRLRYLRRARELQLRDLGGFVYEQARTAGGDHGRQEQLLNEKVRRVRAIDEEIGALSATLGAPDRGLVIREPGVGGTCPTCGELHPSDARFCSNCGTRVDVRGSSGGAQGSVLAAWTNPESQPAAVVAQPAGAEAGVTPAQDAPREDLGPGDARSLRSLAAPSGAGDRDVAAVVATEHDPAPASTGHGPGDAVDLVGPGEAADPADPIDHADPADPADGAHAPDPAEPIDPVDDEAPTRIQPIVTNHQEPR